ncbi:MAG: hypothetical protein ACXVHX_37385 [Solirubrobacteraceae bacterium]|jgi:hypothetical protein
MSVNRHVDKLFVLVLVAVAVVVALVLLTQVGGSSSAVGAGGRPAASIARSQGESAGIPPILPVTRSELAAGRLAETRKRPASVNHVAANARYSTAVFNGYATTRK